jgi:hypothetical protein
VSARVKARRREVLARSGPKAIINRFPGTCTCGARVRSGAGIALVQAGKWSTLCRQHAGEQVGLLVTPSRRAELLVNQQTMADADGSPNFCSRDGYCPHCKADMIGYLGEKCATRGITGCPVCCISFCE